MKLVFLGPPGVGKGTQAKIYCQSRPYAHISTGEMLREAVASGSELGNRAKEIIDNGHLVSDNLMVEVIEERISREDCKAGYVLDGFPRTLPQALALDEMLDRRGEKLKAAVLFELDEEEVFRRLAHRREAEARVDDNEQTQRERIRVYREVTEPLIEFYRGKNQLVTVDGRGSVEDIQSALVEVLS